MNSSVLYTFFIFGFVVFNLLFIYFKLYTKEKYKVSIRLFIAFNVLLTAYILLKQIDTHQEDIASNITKNYTDYSDDLYKHIISLLGNNINKSQVSKDLYDFNINDNTVVGNKIYNNLDKNLDYSSISSADKTICLEINSAISNYALFYYTHIELHEYTNKIKRQNLRLLKIINWYLSSPTYNIILVYYLNGSCGLNTLKFFKEFFNISQKNPILDEEKKIAKNNIIDGKVNGTEIVVSPTMFTSKLYKK
jgi:hypothetical protein